MARLVLAVCLQVPPHGRLVEVASFCHQGLVHLEVAGALVRCLFHDPKRGLPVEPPSPRRRARPGGWSPGQALQPLASAIELAPAHVPLAHREGSQRWVAPGDLRASGRADAAAADAPPCVASYLSLERSQQNGPKAAPIPILKSAASIDLRPSAPLPPHSVGAASGGSSAAFAQQHHLAWTMPWLRGTGSTAACVVRIPLVC